MSSLKANVKNLMYIGCLDLVCDAPQQCLPVLVHCGSVALTFLE